MTLIRRFDAWLDRPRVAFLLLMANTVLGTWLCTRYAYTDDTFDLIVGVFNASRPAYVIARVAAGR